MNKKRRILITNDLTGITVIYDIFQITVLCKCASCGHVFETNASYTQNKILEPHKKK